MCPPTAKHSQPAETQTALHCADTQGPPPPPSLAWAQSYTTAHSHQPRSRSPLLPTRHPQAIPAGLADPRPVAQIKTQAATGSLGQVLAVALDLTEGEGARDRGTSLPRRSLRVSLLRGRRAHGARAGTQARSPRPPDAGPEDLGEGGAAERASPARLRGPADAK